MLTMIQGSRKGIIAAVLGVGAVLAVVAFVYAFPACGCGDPGEAASDNDTAIDLPVAPGASDSLPVVTDPAPSTKPAEVPGAGKGSPPSVPPDAPGARLPHVPVDGGNAGGPVNRDPKDTPVPSPPLTPMPADIVPAAPSVPPAGSATLPKSELPALPAGTNRVGAPIDGLDVAVMESFPVQYLLQIKAGLPSGCAQKAGYEAKRSGNTITVKVYNSMPSGAVACTMIYGMYDLNLNLGSDYQAGQTYTVVVNDQKTTFKAQ
jgi:hypothetical protein